MFKLVSMDSAFAVYVNITDPCINVSDEEVPFLKVQHVAKH